MVRSLEGVAGEGGMGDLGKREKGAGIALFEFVHGPGAIGIVETKQHAGIVQDKVDFLVHQKVVQRKHDAAAADDAEVGCNVMGAVVTKKGYPVPRFHAPICEERGKYVGQPVHLAVGKFFALKFYEGLARGHGRTLAQNVVQRKDILDHARQYTIVEKKGK